VLDNLAYPNGIVFDEATQEIVFSELTHHSISSYSVNESNPSKKEIINNLFGYPDNLKLNEKGDLYVGIPAVRDPSIEYLNQNPSIRKQFLYVPDQILEMMTKDIAGGIKIDLKSGKIT
jgi:sugar lactone lactonase YvrE